MLLAAASSCGGWLEDSDLRIVKVGRKLEDVEGFYELLGVEPDASDEDVRRAGKRLVMRTHPDMGGDEDDFITAVEAYKTLSDPVSRAEYDTRTRAPLASVRKAPAAFVPDIGRDGVPVWYKEPTLVMSEEDVQRVREWHELVLEAAHGFRHPMKIKVGACRCPAGYYVSDDGEVALIGLGTVPQRWAAMTFVLMKMTERK